jgi:hypothetical protein
MTDTCNPSYSGGGDQEDDGSRPTQAKGTRDSISTKGWVRWHRPALPAMWEA